MPLFCFLRPATVNGDSKKIIVYCINRDSYLIAQKLNTFLKTKNKCNPRTIAKDLKFILFTEKLKRVQLNLLKVVNE